MLPIEAITDGDKHIPFSIRATGTAHASVNVKTHYSGSVRDVGARELHANDSPLVLGCARFLGAAKLFLWSLLKLWLFEG